MLELLDGKKTYIISIIGGLFAVAQWMGFAIPEAVYIVLTALGFGTLRHGISKK